MCIFLYSITIVHSERALFFPERRPSHSTGQNVFATFDVQRETHDVGLILQRENIGLKSSLKTDFSQKISLEWVNAN